MYFEQVTQIVIASSLRWVFAVSATCEQASNSQPNS